MAAAPIFKFYKIVFTSCCDATDILEFKYDNKSNYGGIVKPANPATLPAGISNSCYKVSIVEITLSEYTTLPSVPSITNFTIVSINQSADCLDYVNECPTCVTKCYTLYNCDGLSFNTTNDLATYLNTYITIYNASGVIPGTWFVTENTGTCNGPNNDFEVEDVGPPPCECRCFQVTGIFSQIKFIDCQDNVATLIGNPTKFCAATYPIVTGTVGQYQITEKGPCIDDECPVLCYKLTNCSTEEVIYSNSQQLFQYVNSSSVVTLLGYDGCWEVDESTSTGCDCITVTIEDRSGVNEYTANNIGSYNGWGVWEFIVGSDTFYIWNGSPNPSTNWIISLNAYGAIPGPYYTQSKLNSTCPEAASDGTLTGWVIQGGVPWINVQTEVCPGVCECPVDITVVQTFSSCTACEPIVAYKLQNCEKIYEIQYTTQDLSAYVGDVIETDCACWTVQQINYVPPSTTLITIDNSFKTCNDCLSKLYRLIDCSGEVSDIVTKSDLSDYVGTVIKIENCDTCWEVEETREFETLSEVNVALAFKDCSECDADLPCICSKLTNLTLTEQIVEYLDCENNVQEITLQVGESSEKVCLKKWYLPELPLGQILHDEYFGDCQHGVCPPPIFKNSRTVKPGYNTPNCNPDEYDKITCRFADVMYKVVLEKRYGITNCCPDEDEKWLLKKELIDLQAIKDPAYKCEACGCSCKSGKSYSSCNCGN